MQKFRGKRMMGHAFRRCGFKIKVKWKGIGKKKRQLSGLLFFLSILEAGSSAYIFAQTAVQLRSKIHDVDIPMYTMCTNFHS
jgi:hypothetical protein